MMVDMLPIKHFKLGVFLCLRSSFHVLCRIYIVNKATMILNAYTSTVLRFTEEKKMTVHRQFLFYFKVGMTMKFHLKEYGTLQPNHIMQIGLANNFFIDSDGML
ncbi:hypothetical protein ABZP36_024811 [Zizania latifolia]